MSTPTTELYAVADCPVYCFRVTTIGEDQVRRSIWCSSLEQALTYFPIVGSAEIEILDKKG